MVEKNCACNTYLDIRRTPVRENLVFRSKVSLTHSQLPLHDFIDVETPLIKSTPEGARDFVVPSRGIKDVYTSQSPQTFKQLLMVGEWINISNRKML